jgi:hypothetical protein
MRSLKNKLKAEKYSHYTIRDMLICHNKMLNSPSDIAIVYAVQTLDRRVQGTVMRNTE